MNEGKPGTPGASEEPDGDFELARPNSMRSPDAAGTGVEYIADGAAQAAGQPTASAPHAAPTEAPASGAGAAVPGQGGGPAPTVPAPATEVPAPGVTGTVPAPAVAHGTPPPAAEQPKPLHDPDPYSTPPYGEPGPWAPAPPVQHPSATPAHGVPMGAPPVAPEAVAGPGAAPAAPSATPAHGVHMGASPVAPEAVAGPGAAPAPPESAPAHGVPMGAPAVAPEAVAGPGAAPAAPSATPAHGVHMGAPPVAPEAVAGPGAAPAAPEPAPAPQDAPAAGPWARYDPWAAPAAVAPLQQADPVEEDVKRRRGRRRRALVGGALVIALVSGVGGGVVGVQLERNGGIGAVELPQAGVEAPDRDPDSVAGIAAQALPSVVTLHVSGGGKAGTGTGFVLDDRGHILTNDHVVEPAGKNGDITVTFHSGDTAEATVVGRDSGYDLAVVRVKGVRGLTPLPLGNSDNVQVGDPVVAIGAPFDLAGTVTSGIISARERPITAGGENGDGSDVSYVDALQTDAPINPGNSGGPLLDGKGRVVGINSAIRSADGGLDLEGGQSGSIGLGFAIPINQGKRVAEELIEHGKATHPVIGITLDMEYGGDGARVAAEGSDGGPPVSTGGPGAKAGIRPGDVITKVDGRPVHSGEELIVKTRAHRPGDRLELTLERNGEERTVSLVLGSSDGD
ncbi:trypsin-like peptidase domain-containing protein [Streptomyces griseoincarnatus]